MTEVEESEYGHIYEWAKENRKLSELVRISDFIYKAGSHDEN